MSIILNDTSPILFYMSDSSDSTGRTPKTGLTPTVMLSKNGGAFAAAAGTVAEISNGWYKLTPATADVATLGDLGIRATAAGADTWNDKDRVVQAGPVATDYTSARAAKLDDLDAAISTRSSHSAADVWAVGTRTLTSFGTLVADIWAAGTRTLTAISDSAGVSTLLQRITGVVMLAANYVSPPSAADNATALLDLADGIETGVTPRQALRIIAAVAAGDAAGLDTGSITIKSLGNGKVRITATGDADGNRTVTSTDLT